MSFWALLLSSAFVMRSPSTLQGVDSRVDELAVLEAALAERDTEWLAGAERLVVAPQTALDYGHSWVRPNGDRSMGLRGSPAGLVVPEALFEATRAANRQALSLSGVQLPPGVTWRRRCDSAWVLTLSRPGFSADGSQAIVGVTLDEPVPCDARGVTARGARGITYLLERGSDGRWHVVHRGLQWIT